MQATVGYIYIPRCPTTSYWYVLILKPSRISIAQCFRQHLKVQKGLQQQAKSCNIKVLSSILLEKLKPTFNELLGPYQTDRKYGKSLSYLLRVRKSWKRPVRKVASSILKLVTKTQKVAASTTQCLSLKGTGNAVVTSKNLSKLSRVNYDFRSEGLHFFLSSLRKVNRCFIRGSYLMSDIRICTLGGLGILCGGVTTI